MTNILLVEDNEGDVELTRIAFKKSGFECQLDVVNNGEEALEYLRKRGNYADAPTPDMVLLDLNMPRMGGRELMEIVKRDDMLKFIPIIVLTSSQAPKDVMDSYNSYANCYILKPSGLQAFIEFAKQLESFWSGLVQLPQKIAAAY